MVDIILYDVINVRAARSGRGAPLMVSIPKLIVDAMIDRQDGEKIYLDRFKEPEI
jgi:hypothetical protein